MSETYNVDITIEKVNDMIGRYNLYAFRAVDGPTTGGKPVVWYTTGKLMGNMNVNWKADYGAYIATTGVTSKNGKSEIESDAIISSRTDKTINLGQKMVIDQDYKVNLIKGTEGTISITDNYTDSFTCGISEEKDEKYNPICAFPIDPSYTVTITPVSKIVLMFATEIMTTATVVERALGPAVVLDLTAMTSRKVSYSAGDGWKATDGGTVEIIPSDNPLNPLLINPAK